MDNEMTPTTPSGAGGLVELAAKIEANTDGLRYILTDDDQARILAALRSQGWVSVKERLPEPEVQLQLWDEKRGYGHGRLIDSNNSPLGDCWSFNMTSGHNKVTGFNILYYMPLPSPPATENENG